MTARKRLEEDRRAAGYSGRSMWQKLGLKDGSSVVLVDAPARWSIPDLPTGIRLRRTVSNDFQVAIWFVRSLNDLRRRLKQMAAATPPASSLWVAWPRRAGGHQSDVTERAIRELVLPLGLVDVKIAALDPDWSGQKLVWRLTHRAGIAARR